MYEERFFHHFLSQPQVFVTIIVCSGDLGVAGTWAAVRGRLTEARGGCKSLVIQAVCILPLAFRRHSLGEACMTDAATARTPRSRGALPYLVRGAGAAQAERRRAVLALVDGAVWGGERGGGRLSCPMAFLALAFLRRHNAAICVRRMVGLIL